MISSCWTWSAVPSGVSNAHQHNAQERGLSDTAPTKEKLHVEGWAMWCPRQNYRRQGEKQAVPHPCSLRSLFCTKEFRLHLQILPIISILFILITASVLLISLPPVLPPSNPFSTHLWQFRQLSKFLNGPSKLLPPQGQVSACSCSLLLFPVCSITLWHTEHQSNGVWEKEWGKNWCVCVCVCARVCVETGAGELRQRGVMF